MPRIRTIKPEFWDDKKLASITRDARLTFIGLWNYSDDFGVVKSHSQWLKNKIYPYDEIKLSEFQKWLSELEEIGAIVKFMSDGEDFYYIRNFLRHQVINRPNKNSRNPEYCEGSVINHGTITDESLKDHGALPSGREGKGMERKGYSADHGTITEHSVIHIPLSGNGHEYPVQQEEVDEWIKLFPGIDVIQELRSLRAWNLANPKKRKTIRGVKTHIVGWLSRSQDKPKPFQISDEPDGPRSKILRAPDGN